MQPYQTAEKEVIFLIADISGYTRFIVSNTISIIQGTSSHVKVNNLTFTDEIVIVHQNVSSIFCESTGTLTTIQAVSNDDIHQSARHQNNLAWFLVLQILRYSL